jgi:hypothetical protein
VLAIERSSLKLVVARGLPSLVRVLEPSLLLLLLLL